MINVTKAPKSSDAFNLRRSYPKASLWHSVVFSVSLWWPEVASHPLEGVAVEESESSLWIKQNLKYS